MIQPISNYKNKNINFNNNKSKNNIKYEYGSQKFIIDNNKTSNSDEFVKNKSKKSDKIKTFLTLFLGLSVLSFAIFHKTRLL